LIIKGKNMQSEEDSKLISDLYNAKHEPQIYDVLEYMDESGNGIFVYPILDGYKKHRYSSVGYYFIWSLSRLDYQNLGRRLNELLESYEIQKEHIPMALFLMAERNYFSDIGDRMAAMYLDYCADLEFRQDFNLNGIGLGCVLDYLFKQDMLIQYENKLRELIFSKDTDNVEKAVSLNYLLDFKQEEQIDFFIENYFTKVQHTGLEKSIAKKLLFCKTENAKKLKKLILENGNAESVEILENLGKKIGSFRSDTPENTIYSNSDVMIKICILRAQMNNKTLVSEGFGFKIFPGNELIIYQSQSIDDREIFFDLCKELLEVIRAVDPVVRSHGFSKKEAREIWVNVGEQKEEMLLPQLLLFLSSRKVGVDYNFYGFRQLDMALEAVVEHTEDEEFFKTLRRLGVEQMYREKKWHSIHSFFLNYYLQVLENMNKELNHLVKRD